MTKTVLLYIKSRHISELVLYHPSSGPLSIPVLSITWEFLIIPAKFLSITSKREKENFLVCVHDDAQPLCWCIHVLVLPVCYLCSSSSRQHVNFSHVISQPSLFHFLTLIPLLERCPVSSMDTAFGYNGNNGHRSYAITWSYGDKIIPWLSQHKQSDIICCYLVSSFHLQASRALWWKISVEKRNPQQVLSKFQSLFHDIPNSLWENDLCTDITWHVDTEQL